MEIASSIFLLGVLVMYSAIYFMKREHIENIKRFRRACYFLPAAVATHFVSVAAGKGLAAGFQGQADEAAVIASFFQGITGLILVISLFLFWASILSRSE